MRSRAGSAQRRTARSASGSPPQEQAAELVKQARRSRRELRVGAVVSAPAVAAAAVGAFYFGGQQDLIDWLPNWLGTGWLVLIGVVGSVVHVLAAFRDLQGGARESEDADQVLTGEIVLCFTQEGAPSFAKLSLLIDVTSASRLRPGDRLDPAPDLLTVVPMTADDDWRPRLLPGTWVNVVKAAGGSVLAVSAAQPHEDFAGHSDRVGRDTT